MNNKKIANIIYLRSYLASFLAFVKYKELLQNYK